MRFPSYGGCKTLTAATVGVFFFAERISNTGLTGIALEHRPEAVMLCYIVDGPLVQITMEVLIMKQKNENKSDSAVYKSRTEPTQHIVVVNFDGSEPKEKCIEHEEVLFDRTDRVTFALDAVPDHIRGSLAAATLELVSNIKARPGGAAQLEARTKARRASKIWPMI